MKEEFVVGALMVFLDGAAKRGKLKKEVAEKLKKRCLGLKDIGELDEIIDEVNGALPGSEAKYPKYDVSSPVFEVKGQIFAFQHFLRGKLDEKKIKIENEVPLFRQATRLWAYVGDTVPLDNGMKEFAELIDKTNEFFPENERYPTLSE